MKSIDSSSSNRETKATNSGEHDTGRFRLLLEARTRLVRKLDPARSRLSWPTACTQCLSGACYSFLRWIQHESHADALKAATITPPIFVIGFWRSGTTFLHELFCCDPRLGFPSTYACLNPSHFLLSERIVRAQAAQQEIRRPMDNMRYSWISPQEDEFALLALGAPSPYEALLVPSLMRDPRSLVDLRFRSLDEQGRWTEAIQYFIRLLALQQGKPMVLKSPPHGFRLHVLPTLFPKSRYVVIERNPFEVFASNLKLWRTLLNLYSWESFSMEEVEDFILAAYPLHEEAITAGAGVLQSGSLARVRYEELVRDPMKEMARLYEELDLGDFETVRPRIDRHLAGVADYKRNSFRLSAAQRRRIEQAWGKAMERKGYSWPEDRVSLGA
jgi:hypothetical protein